MFRSLLCALCLAAATQAAPQTNSPAKSSTPQPAKAFKSFTGKVAANKVRIRIKPDLDSHILRQVNKNDLLLVVGEEGDFFAVEPPKETKAYVFRSYVLDGLIEANRVNVRLEPHVDAPIIGQLQAGDRVEEKVCPLNHKWLEIGAPKGTRFYVSKEYIVQAGGPDYLAKMDKRKSQVEELLNSSFIMAEKECKKDFETMAPQQAIDQLQTIVRDFSDFPEAVAQAKEALALLKETFLNKKIAFLESKAELSQAAKQELIAKHQEESKSLFVDAPIQLNPDLWGKRNQKKEMTNAMHMWDALEESLYLSWSAFHSGKKLDDFYAEQKANASVLTGVIESYAHQVKDRPGDYILRSGESPVAYLYSTHIDLEKFAGKTVTVIASPRPNNHFAFPAYFVLSIEP